MTATSLNVIAFLCPLIGIAISAWSFRWSEIGATPDQPWDSYGSNLDGEEITVQAGERWRARRWARFLFNTGALFLAAGVPLGNAGNHVTDPINWLAISGYAILVTAIGYAAKEMIGIWHNLREDAFSIYFSKEMYFPYDRDKVRQMYFALNPMPFSSVWDANWYATRKLPDIHEVARLAPKTQA